MPAGLAVAEAVFARVDPTLSFEALADDGGWREPGPLAELNGAAASILAGERVALNFLGRLSGVATLTARFVAAVRAEPERASSTPARPRRGCASSRRTRSAPAVASTTAAASTTPCS